MRAHHPELNDPTELLKLAAILARSCCGSRCWAHHTDHVRDPEDQANDSDIAQSIHPDRPRFYTAWRWCKLFLDLIVELWCSFGHLKSFLINRVFRLLSQCIIEALLHKSLKTEIKQILLTNECMLFLYTQHKLADRRDTPLPCQRWQEPGPWTDTGSLG